MVRLPGPTSFLRKLDVLKQSGWGLAKVRALNLPNQAGFVVRVQHILLWHRAVAVRTCRCIRLL